MAFSKEQILQTMRSTGLVPLFSHDDAQEAQKIIEAAYQGGVRVFEFTNRKHNSLEVFRHLHSQRSRYPELMLGIGTIMDVDTTKKFIDAGADFIISPVMKPEMATICHEHNIHWIPGCATLTEIVNARDHGAQVIKVFPGSVLGPGFISSITPVVPGLNLMITGGVEPTDENLSAWFKAGAMCVGLGSHLFTKDILEKKDWPALQERVSKALQSIQRIKK